MNNQMGFQMQLGTRRRLLALLAGILLFVGFSAPVQAAHQAHGQHGTQCSRTHTVQRGENLFRIAKYYGVSMSTLQQWNKIQDPNRIYVGQRLCVAVKTSVPEAPTARPTHVEFISALQTVRIRQGPGLTYGVIGHLRAGATARVTGISQNGNWWQVLCPSQSSGSCWVSAQTNLTRPVGAPGQGPGWGKSAAIIESVSIQVLESYPVQVRAVVRGYLPDGCTYIDGFRQQREGNTVRIQIDTGRSEGFCIQALVPFEQVISLDAGPWNSGLYSVVVDGVRSDFYLP